MVSKQTILKIFKHLPPSFGGAKGMVMILILTCCATWVNGQNLWHGKQRKAHYLPQGRDFVKVEGKHRFNRALYGGNSGFRVEAGDLPEFALYMPGMGGNLQFEISANGITKRLTAAESIQTVYRPGAMLYTVKDKLLGKGSITFHVLALHQAEGIIIKSVTQDIPVGVKLRLLYGGASGKKFSRDGDIGADPESSFDLKPEYCEGNVYAIQRNTFTLQYKIKKEAKELKGIFPEHTRLAVQYFDDSTHPYMSGELELASGQTAYYLVSNTATAAYHKYTALEKVFNQAEADRKTIAERVSVNTPDSFINTLGGTLAIAADAVFEDPSFLHGAIAWRMRLNAWRGAYAADPLGWHDRARTHFSSYAKSQVTTPLSGPVVADTALGMARQLEKMGTSMFSSGYICRNPNGDLRPHHYDMNLVFIDQLLNHFNYTGDTAYMREMWPVIKRHLAWEKRNYDADDDGLYDAYACIWASDALQYNGGAVTHSSAYNYRANKAAAQLAALLKEDSAPYEKEAEKTHNAIRLALWLPRLGSYAEYKDNIGSGKVHTAAGLWTIYHTLDAGVPDLFQAYQALKYVDNEIPHIPVLAEGIKDKSLFLLSTTNWQPYTWSVNNVALAENLHTALAYWQGGQRENAYTLWKSSLLESMYLGTSPGNFQQLSFYDAVRGELYRDFADPIGMAARTLTEGLFGILPDALNDTLLIKPGFPEVWDHASLAVPDCKMDFKRDGLTDRFTITPAFPLQLNLKIQLPARFAAVTSVEVNGKKADFSFEENINQPAMIIRADKAGKYNITVHWREESWEKLAYPSTVTPGKKLEIKTKKSVVTALHDPQEVLSAAEFNASGLSGIIKSGRKQGTFFVQLKQNNTTWWQAIDLAVTDKDPLREDDFIARTVQVIPMDTYFNDKVTHIFTHKYMSPRWPYPTLQLPVQGIGNWCYPKVLPEINDEGIRRLAGTGNTLLLPRGLKFATPADTSKNNILFTSQWDNFPRSASIPLKGKGKYLSLLLCGSTNHMQSQTENGRVTVTYTDGTKEELILFNPDNWWPVEQDYMEDGYAFQLKGKKPLRLHLKTGKTFDGFAPDSVYTSLKGFSNRVIDGGAALVLNVPIAPGKELKSLTLAATANEVVIGLMAVSLVKEADIVAESKASMPQERDIQYLSGTDKDHTLDWDFYCTEGRKSGAWSTIPVPSCWEQQGFGEYNYGRDYKTYGKDFQFAAEQGFYRHQFRVEDHWKGKEIYLTFEGVMTDAEVKINDIPAGEKHQGAFYRFRYNVTDKLKYNADNVLEVTVHKMSADASVNNAERLADYWIFGGIFRPVYLEAFPQTYISHCAIDARADGSIALQVFPENTADAAKVRVVITDGKGHQSAALLKDLSITDTVVSLKGKVSAPLLWSSETPDLYTAQVSLLDHEGKLLYTTKQKFGFRTIEVRKGDGIYINGVHVKMKGINRHSFWPESGRTLSDSVHLLDVQLMKDMNMNAVRMSHYPPDERFLDICDSLGLYVIDELAGWQKAYKTPVGKKLVKEMVQRDVNHPSVIFWSNGNEGGHNKELDGEFAKYDPSGRPVIHAHHKAGNAFNGIDCNHYEDYYSTAKLLQDTNIYMPTEMLHCQDDGGGGAGLHDLWELHQQSKRSGGVFLWALLDEGIVRTDQDNRIDVNGVNAPDGVLGPHREKEGSYFAIKEIFAPVKMDADAASTFNGKVTLENRYHFTNFNKCSVHWSLVDFNKVNSKETGYKTKAAGVCAPLSIKPGSRGVLNIKLPVNYRESDACILTIKDPYGKEISSRTFTLKEPMVFIDAMMALKKSSDSLVVAENDTAFLMKAGRLSVTINRKTGLLAKVEKDGDINLADGPVLVAGKSAIISSSMKKVEEGYCVESNYSGDLTGITWTLQHNGWLKLEYRYQLKGDYPFTGVSFSYPENYVLGAKWLGNGPYRVWKNRLYGNSVNVWSNSYNNTQTGSAPWIFPEFKGYYSNVHWMELNTVQGKIIMAAAEKDMYLRLFDFYGLSGIQPAPALPSGNISFLDNIPPVGTKLALKIDPNTAALGPESEGNHVDHTYNRTLYFYFGLLNKKAEKKQQFNAPEKDELFEEKKI